MPEPTLLAAGVIVFGVIMYVVLDGFDLGVGILFPFAEDTEQRDVMVNSIAPVWDGNETWLILGGSVLFSAFPIAYAAVMPAFYIPVMLLLFALIFRGVAFEFRMKAKTSKWWWSTSFFLGSAGAAFAQGLLLGGLIEGVETAEGEFAGGAFDWLTLGSVIDGLALIAGYGLLGATWLIIKAEGPLQAWARAFAARLTLVVLLFMAVVSVYTPLTRPDIATRWFSGDNLVYLWPVPFAVLLVAFVLWRGLRTRATYTPFVCSILLFLLGFLGLGISLWPNIVPPDLTIWEAAAPPASQWFVLIFVAITMPMILGYTWYAYRVFQGKVSAEGGYAE